MVEADGGRPLTFFEVLTVLGVRRLRRRPGLRRRGRGGSRRYVGRDERRRCLPVGVVMPVGMDHMDWLGDDIATIAGQKAGIIKPGMVVVLAEQDPMASDVLLERAAEVGAMVAARGCRLRSGRASGRRRWASAHDAGCWAAPTRTSSLPLHGEHQAHNAACALVAVEAFLGGGSAALDGDLVGEGFASVSVPGRLEVMRRSPTVLARRCAQPAWGGGAGGGRHRRVHLRPPGGGGRRAG